jgi:hypothetical protein
MKQSGMMKLEGTIDDVTFYKSQDGFRARKKGGVSKERIKSDPKFARTRENGREFASASNAGKVLRDAIKTLMKNARDSRIVSRLQLIMSRIQKMDTTSVRGSRTVGTAIIAPAAKAMLKGFEFNGGAQLSSILFKPYAVDLPSGKITISQLEPANEMEAPEGATHVTLRGAFANVDFSTGTSVIEYTDEVNLLIDSNASDVMLTPAGVPAGTGTKLYLLLVEFFQEVNGVQYSLSGGASNALVIAEVA